jgi:hypothetical protein
MLDDGVDLVPFILEIALPVAVRKMIPGDSRQALASGLGEDGVLISLVLRYRFSSSVSETAFDDSEMNSSRRIATSQTSPVWSCPRGGSLIHLRQEFP